MSLQRQVSDKLRVLVYITIIGLILIYIVLPVTQSKTTKVMATVDALHKADIMLDQRKENGDPPSEAEILAFRKRVTDAEIAMKDALVSDPTTQALKLAEKELDGLVEKYIKEKAE